MSFANVLFSQATQVKKTARKPALDEDFVSQRWYYRRMTTAIAIANPKLAFTKYLHWIHN